MTKDGRDWERYRSQHKELIARLAQIGFIWGGSVQKQWMSCGKPGCACAQDPKARHGPYVYWTSKINGRTVTRLLHPPESEILSEWVENRRELDRVLTEMKKLSQKALKVILRIREREKSRDI